MIEVVPYGDFVPIPFHFTIDDGEHPHRRHEPPLRRARHVRPRPQRRPGAEDRPAPRRRARDRARRAPVAARRRARSAGRSVSTCSTSRCFSIVTMTTIPATKNTAPPRKAAWKPVSERFALLRPRSAAPAGPSSALVVRLTASVERIASPSAPPTCWEVLKSPDARPASSCVDATRREQRHRHEGQPHPDRDRDQPGSTSARYVPFASARQQQQHPDGRDRHADDRGRADAEPLDGRSARARRRCRCRP